MKKLIISFLLIFCVCINLYFAEAKTVDKIKLNVNDKDLIIDLEDNTSSKALVDKLSQGSIKIDAKDYGSFEKVGKLGFTLPTDNKEITTEAGDLILFDGDQISLYYDTNIWSLTKIGKVENISQEELKNLLGTGNVTMTLSLIDEETSNEVTNNVNDINTVNVVNSDVSINTINNVVNNIASNQTQVNQVTQSNTAQVTVVNNADTTTSNVSLPNVGENISHILGIAILVLVIFLVIKYNKRG